VPISGVVAGRRPATSASELAQSRRGLQQAPVGEATPSRRPLVSRAPTRRRALVRRDGERRRHRRRGRARRLQQSKAPMAAPSFHSALLVHGCCS
jgi:hypothetical protein